MIQAAPKLGAALLVFSFMLSSCDKKHEESGSAESNGSSSVGAPGKVDAEEAIQAAIDELSSETYEDVKGSAACTDDCSGHNAGFEWAKENRIVDASSCGGNSASFIEGCEAYGEEIASRTQRIEGRN